MEPNLVEQSVFPQVKPASLELLPRLSIQRGLQPLGCSIFVAYSKKLKAIPGYFLNSEDCYFLLEKSISHVPLLVLQSSISGTILQFGEQPQEHEG